MNKKEKIIEKIEEEINKSALKLGNLPDYLFPKVNVSNDYAYPFVEVDNNGIIYIIIREKGVEYERNVCLDINDTIYKLFEKITFELSVNEEKNNKDYSIERIKNRQKELLKLVTNNV